MIRTETLEDRVLLTQTVTPSPVAQTVGASSDVNFAIDYTTDDDTLTGLTLRIHFDSSQYEFSGNPARDANGDVSDATAIVGTDLISNPVTLNLQGVQVADDTVDDFDNDPATDKHILILWADVNGFWPRGPLAGSFPVVPNVDPIVQPFTLLDLNLTTIDTFDETSGPLNINFSGEAAAGQTFESTPATVNFQEGPPTVSIAAGAGATVTEGTAATFDVSISRQLQTGETPVVVNFDTSNGTAVSPGDFTAATSGTVTFNPGDAATQTISVATINDTIPEGAETFSVTLSSPTGAILGTATAQGTINDDGDLPVVSLSGDQTVEEGGTLSFDVTLSVTPVQEVTVDVSTADGSADAATDFTALTQTLTFAAGASGAALTQTVVINTTEDDIAENIESFTVALSNIVAASGVGSATGTITDDDGNGAISGVKFHDRNLNGVRDAGEEGLQGFVITLTDTASNATVTQTSGADGTYIFEQVPPGEYTVTETQQEGFRQSAPGTAASQTAYELDQSLNLFSSGNDFEDWGGLGERWVQGDGGWYYITPDGAFFEWNGSPRTQLSGNFVAQLDSSFHTDLSSLYDADAPNGHTITLAANEQLTDIDFGNFQLGTISGNKFLDANENGAFDSGESFLSGWTIQLIDANGNILDSEITDANGEYEFDDVVPGTYFIREVPQDGFVQTFPAIDPNAVLAEEAFYLDQENGFTATENDFFDWGSRNERWFQSSTGYHFITPNGNIFDWDGSTRDALTGTLVGSLDSTYYDDLSLITDAQFPGGTTLTVESGEAVSQNFGNAESNTGLVGDFGTGNVSASVSNGDLVITGDDFANGVAVFLNDDGYIVVYGMGDTTINGQDEAYVAFQSNTVPDDLRINLNGNNNLLTLEGFNVNDDVRIWAGDGIDHILLENVNINDDLYIDTNLGNDIVGLNGVRVNDRTTIDTDDGHDVVAVIDSVHVDDARIDLSEGHDSLYVDGSSFGDDVRVTMNSGDDNVAVIDSVVADRADIDGGSGFDSLLNDGSTAGSFDVDSFESNDIPTLDSDIDTVLAELADRGINFDF